MTTVPSSVLFACNYNAVRSPMAHAILGHLGGGRIRVDSCGVRAGTFNGFTLAVMREIGIDLAGFEPKDFQGVIDKSFDLIISLTPEAHHHALELTRTHHHQAIYWPIFDPTAVSGSRDQIVEAFRGVRDDLMRRIVAYFGLRPVPNP